MRFEVRPGSRRNGLPLDRRELRSMVRDQAAGKRVLELFAGTGALSVASLVGGAASVTAVEASRGLAAWTEANLRLNGGTTGNAHVVCQDPLEFVRSLPTAGEAPFDLIVVEPPSFGGKRRAGVWNVQDGHAELIGGLLGVLAPGGRIYFMTTFRRLKFQAERISHARAHEITRQTIPPDFRDKKVHRAWVVSANNS
jgi:23S rRNA (guanine2445-N2)-methyltransferase / 23S rRNA (guanine2069-N7)-methyltransferase